MWSNALKVTDLHATAKKILLAHFLLCGVSLIKIVMLLVANIYDATFLNFAVGKIGNTGLENGVGKFCIFLQYICGLAVLALYVIGVQIVLHYGQIRENGYLRRNIPLLFYFLLNGIYTFRLISGGNDFAHWAPYWLLFMFLLPVCWITLPLRSIRAIPTWLSASLTAGLLLQVWLVFQPMIFKPMLIENDYMDISGQTQLQTGEWVDNTQFINQHNIGGITKYDPRLAHNQLPEWRPGTFVTVPPTLLFEKLLEANRFNDKYHLVYDARKNQLLVKGFLPEKERDLLRAAFTAEKDRQSIDQLYLIANEQRSLYEHRVYTPQEWDFIQKNEMELRDQGRTGWFFYHHNYFFTPIFAAAHGGDFSKVTMVYGWLNTLVFAKLLTWMGGVNYQNYFHLFFAFYPLYYAGFLLLLLLIFKRVEYGLLGLLLAVAGLFGLGIELLRLAPGLNPLRHFLDLPVFMFFYFYARERKLPWLLLSYACSFLALACSKEFGLFLIGALSATVVIRALYERRGWLPSMVAVAASATALVLFTLIPGKNPGYSYMLLGIGSPVTPSGLVVFALAASGLLYYVALVFRDIKDPINYFWLSVLFYCQFLMIYVLWFPMLHHFFNLAAPLAILILCVIHLYCRYKNQIENERIWLSGLLALAFLFYAPAALMFYFGMHQYNRNFATHKIYDWPFATAQLQSTMDPQLFEKSAALINKYVPHENSIYIISRYDTLLPILAGKYSAMPFNELLTNVITTNDEQLLADFIAAKQPQYLFVDSDIDRNFNNDIFMASDPLSRELDLDKFSGSRASTLFVLPRVFAKIKQDYQSVARGELITVYQRKT